MPHFYYEQAERLHAGSLARYINTLVEYALKRDAITVENFLENISRACLAVGPRTIALLNTIFDTDDEAHRSLICGELKTHLHNELSALIDFYATLDSVGN